MAAKAYRSTWGTAVIANEGTDLALRLDNVGRTYGEHRALSGVSLSLGPQEILGVIGPSGAGKSTLLKCIDLLETVDEGEIIYRVDGEVRVGPGGLASTGSGLERQTCNTADERLLPLRASDSCSRH